MLGRDFKQIRCVVNKQMFHPHGLSRKDLLVGYGRAVSRQPAPVRSFRVSLSHRATLPVSHSFQGNLHPGTTTGGGTFQADSGHLGV